MLVGWRAFRGDDQFPQSYPAAAARPQYFYRFQISKKSLIQVRSAPPINSKFLFLGNGVAGRRTEIAAESTAQQPLNESTVGTWYCRQHADGFEAA